MSKYPKPKNGASLLLSFRLHAHTVVIIGSGKLAASRAFACLEAGSHVIILGQGGLTNACEEVRWRVEVKEIEWRSMEEEAAHWITRTDASSSSPTVDEDEAALLSVLSSAVSPVSFVCITDTIIPANSSKSPNSRSKASAMRLYTIASQKHRIPTNVTDMPALCDFSFPSTHRFQSAHSGEPTALQIGVLTNSKGCRLSSRITREIVARLPRGVGDAVDNVGRLRERAKADDRQLEYREITEGTGYSAGNSNSQAYNDGDMPSTPNEPVPQTPLKSLDSAKEDFEPSLERTQRRMRWVAQVSEYWPFESLASLGDEAINDILDGSVTAPPRANLSSDSVLLHRNDIAASPTRHAMPPLSSPPISRRGRILLLGSGPGHPSLLTLSTSYALRAADLVLSDKLVPEAVLNIIPKNVELRIAKKFPGNADRAQEELMHAAVEGAQQGKVVVRLKQGDPMLYARASSEIEYFTSKGFPPAVIPGLSSALAAPLAAGIPVTARGVAESVVICTGVSKGGKGGRIPLYERATTVLVLMGVARLAEITQAMMLENKYPDYIPTCIVERGTMPDQRVVRSTLAGIMDAMSDPRVGPQRPPGMMIVGWACLGVAEGVEGVSEDSGEGLIERDLARVQKWLAGEKFVVKEGLDESWEGV